MHELLARRGRPLFVGVVHLAPLPGAPAFGAAGDPGDVELVLERAAADASALARGGADALIVENFGDAPFFKERVPPETVAAMALAVRAVRAAAPALPVGVNVLRNDARAALGLCAATGASFLRVNVHVGAVVSDQGILEGRAARTLRLRARLAPSAALLADVHVKHAVPLGGGALADAAHDAFTRGRADALIVTGRATGSPPDPADLASVRERVPRAPLFIGSGLTPERASELGGLFDGAIVGTSLKEGGLVTARVELARVQRMRAALDALS